MNPTSVVVVGGEVPAQYRGLPFTLIRLPGESGPVDGDTFAPATLDACMVYLRQRFANHGSIAGLAGARVVAGPGDLAQEWAARVEAKLCELLDDLGNCSVDSWNGARNAILNGTALAENPSSAQLCGQFAGETALVIGSGPSAGQYFEAIARIRSGVRIFCADTILDGLLAAGIVPDYVCAIEREAVIGKVLDGNENCGATLIASPFVVPECVKKWGKKVLFWWGGDEIYRWLAPQIPAISSGRSAGSLAVAAAMHAGCSQIYLVGHDLSYQNGQSHSAEAHQLAHAAAKRASEGGSTGNPMAQRCLTPGNGGAPVETTGLWNRVRGDIEGIVANYPEARAYNVNRHSGARIAGVPVGDLPENMPALPPPRELPASGIVDHFKRIPAVRFAAGETGIRLGFASTDLDNGRDLKEVAESLQMSRLCGEYHAPLFQYIASAVFSAMQVRLNISAAHGLPADDAHRNALRITIGTLKALMCRVLDELHG